MQQVDECDIMQDSPLDEKRSDHPYSNRVSKGNSIDTSSRSKPLQDLFHRSCENLTEDQKTSLSVVLDKYNGVSSSSPMDLGRTNVLHHGIPTGSPGPIKLPPRRTPRAFVKQEEKIIKEQLEAGLIRESNNPWSAALVFVKKLGLVWTLGD